MKSYEKLQHETSWYVGRWVGSNSMKSVERGASFVLRMCMGPFMTQSKLCAFVLRILDLVSLIFCFAFRAGADALLEKIDRVYECDQFIEGDWKM